MLGWIDAFKSILPAGSVKDEPTFFLLLGLLIAFIGAAIYLRVKRKRREGQSEAPSTDA
jgi:LPXTG-motif cell wall-anchored protein